MKSLLGTLLLAGLTGLSPAMAAEPEAQMAWSLEFGGSATTVQPLFRLGLAMGGLPVLDRTFRASATEGAAPEESAEEAGSSSWVPWVVGGLVAIVAIGADTAKDQGYCAGCMHSEGDALDNPSNGTSVSGVEDGAVGCVNGECAACPDGRVASDCDGLVTYALRGEVEIDVERQRWLDAGTGHMGDLIARY